MESGVVIENCIKTEDWQLDKPSQSFKTSRVYKKKIFFKKHFNNIPEVLVNICSVDSANSSNLKILVLPEEITREGFVLVFKTWHDAIIHQIGVTWLAYEN